ncbi:hypothetical protein chiPu_0029038, partial [Chiloscyllium punctatum]|nr:hypothetical protein [Chiloscyllium punctatum]
MGCSRLGRRACGAASSVRVCQRLAALVAARRARRAARR